MDRIRLHGIEIYAYHGVLPAEQELGQRFVIDTDLWFDCTAAARDDDLDQALDYSLVHGLVTEAATGTSFKLLEAVAGRLCTVLLSELPVQRVAVTVCKLNPPIAGFSGTASVTLERDSSWLDEKVEDAV